MAFLKHPPLPLAAQRMVWLPIDTGTVVDDAIASEVEAIEWSSEHPTGGWFNFGGGVGAIDESSVAAQRIETWLVSESVDR